MSLKIPILHWILTSLFVNGEHWNIGAGSPCSQFGRLINQTLKVSLGSLILLSTQDGTEVLRHLRQTSEVSADVFRGSVVVIKNRRYLIAHNVPRLPDADVEGKEAMHNRKDKDEKRMLEEAAHPQVRLLLLILLRDGRSVINGRQMGLHC